MAQTYEQQIQYSADRKWVWVSGPGVKDPIMVPKEAFVVADLLAHRIMTAASNSKGYSQGHFLIEALRTFVDHDVLGCGNMPPRTAEPDDGGEIDEGGEE